MKSASLSHNSNIKGRWQPSHQFESFHWSIIYTVIETPFKELPFLFIRQHEVWNEAQLRIATVTRFSWYFAANTTVV